VDIAHHVIHIARHVIHTYYVDPRQHIGGWRARMLDDRGESQRGLVAARYRRHQAEAEAEAEAGGRRCRPRGCVLGAKPRLLTQLASYDAARNIWQALLHGAVDGCLHRRAYYQRPGALRQGLTLVHFSAQLEPCLTHTNTLHTINTP